MVLDCTAVLSMVTINSKGFHKYYMYFFDIMRHSYLKDFFFLAFPKAHLPGLHLFVLLLFISFFRFLQNFRHFLHFRISSKMFFSYHFRFFPLAFHTYFSFSHFLSFLFLLIMLVFFSFLRDVVEEGGRRNGLAPCLDTPPSLRSSPLLSIGKEA